MNFVNLIAGDIADYLHAILFMKFLAKNENLYEKVFVFLRSGFDNYVWYCKYFIS